MNDSYDDDRDNLSSLFVTVVGVKKNVKNGIFLHEVEKFELDLLLFPFTSHVQKLFAEPWNF